MFQTTVQRGSGFTLTIWQAAVTGLLILFLCVPPTWAAMICNCPPEQESLHACCQTMKSARASENKHQNHTSGKRASHCQTTQMPSANSQVRKSAQYAMTCCEPTPPRELENAELSSAPPMGAEESLPLPVASHQHISQAPPFIHRPLRQTQRPLYIALSCWLI